MIVDLPPLKNVRCDVCEQYYDDTYNSQHAAECTGLPSKPKEVPIQRRQCYDCEMWTTNLELHKRTCLVTRQPDGTIRCHACRECVFDIL